jgi:hypothetical protein
LVSSLSDWCCKESASGAASRKAHGGFAGGSGLVVIACEGATEEHYRATGIPAGAVAGLVSAGYHD